jgi:hypothetical protein
MGGIGFALERRVKIVERLLGDVGLRRGNRRERGANQENEKSFHAHPAWHISHWKPVKPKLEVSNNRARSDGPLQDYSKSINLAAD